MKFSSPTIALLLLPFMVLGASTWTDDSPLTPSSHDPRSVLDPRRVIQCSTVNLSHNEYVHCRSGPGTNYLSMTRIASGKHVPFECYEEGECIHGNL